MIILRNFSLRRGTKVLLEPADLTIQPGQHIALTGANGCGKSSLFAFLQGELDADSGSAEGLEGLRIACMAQEVEATNDTALDYLLGGDTVLADLRHRLQAAEAAEDFETVAALHSRLDDIHGYDAEHRAERLLLGLGFADGDSRRPVRDFSGGWRIRLNLGRALMKPSDLLLLDEPTNHLDLDATLWLQQWLQAYQGTLLLISHDREFIDASCERVLHIENRQIRNYKGNYSEFEKRRAEFLSQQQAEYEKQQQRIAEIDAFVARFRYKATKAKQAQSRLKELARMQTIAPAHIDSPFHFNFPDPGKASDPLLELDKAALGYGESAVLRKVNLQLRPGSRIGLLGRNGAGKTTLLKSLTGDLPLLGGERREGQYCRVGYFDQQQLEALDLRASPLQHLQRLRRDAREQDILDFLGGLNFRGDMATGIIEPFSGGEKARLALAITAWQAPALLILDEPTNHLDMEMRLALTLALQTFSGAVVLVTHDRHLLRNSVDELLLVHDGRVEEYPGDVAAYERWVLSRPEEDSAEEKPAAADPGRKANRQAAAQKREQLRPLKRDIEAIEKQLDSAREELASIEGNLADTDLYQSDRADELETLLRRQGALRNESETLEEQWLDLQERLEALEQAPPPS